MDLDEARQQATITVEELWCLLGKSKVGRSSLYDAVRTGAIPSFKVGRRILIPTAPLLQALGISEGGVPNADSRP